MKDENFEEYFSGKKLYGDDFNRKQIEAWFNDEKEGYSGLISEAPYFYEFHELNKIHGYNKIKRIKEFSKVLSFGGASGDELLPIIDRIKEVIILEPSHKLRVGKIGGKKIEYISPNASGKIDLPEGSIDLITCFAVLHHIPNISFVIQELTRILKKGGFILLREPIVSMGDWRKERKGLTLRERGIPLNIFKQIILQNGLEILSEDRVLFPTTRRIWDINNGFKKSKLVIYLDILLSKIFSWNKKYHATKAWHKIRPQSVFFVLRKKFV